MHIPGIGAGQFSRVTGKKVGWILTIQTSFFVNHMDQSAFITRIVEQCSRHPYHIASWREVASYLDPVERELINRELDRLEMTPRHVKRNRRVKPPSRNFEFQK